MNKTKSFLATILSVVVAFSLVPQVHADVMSTTAIPPKVELKGNPGQTLNATLKVRNDSIQTQNYTIIVEDFVVIDSIGTPIPVATKANNRWSLANWITAPEEVPVDASGIQIVNVSIKIPMTALPGGHYAMLTYTPNASSKTGDLKQTGNVITSRVGTLFYVTVSGPVNEKATITKFQAPKFTEMGPVEFAGTIESMSDIHVNPKGTITISNPINNKVAEIKIDAGNIFPEAVRDFTATWNQKWGWGRYKADLNLVYGTAASALTATIFFWLFPIRIIIYSLILLISILTVIIILNKRSKKHQIELEKEVQILKEELQQIENK